MFNAPIPGQSLTSEPKNYPWENPPLMVDPEEALLFHLEKLEDKKTVESIAGLMALGVDILDLTEGILRAGVASGQHSIDVSLIIAPVIHEYIKGIGDAAGIDYKEGLVDEDEEELNLSTVSVNLREQEARKILQDIKDKRDPDLSELEEPEEGMEEDMSEEEPEAMQAPEPQMKTQEPQEEKPMGLMARRNA